jgi:hypothetical protein
VLSRDSEQVGELEWLGKEGDCPEQRGQMRTVGEARENDDRDGRPRWVRKLVSAELGAIHHRHHQVKNYQAGQQAGTQMVKSFLAVAGLVYGITFSIEEVGEDIASVTTIIDQEDATVWMRCCHGSSAPPKRSAGSLTLGRS